MAAKDITALIAQVNAAIDPAAPTGGITATVHNAALVDLVESLGWWSGFRYSIINGDNNDYDQVIEIGAQNYNDSTPTIRVAKHDSFGVDNSIVLDLMVKNSAIILRDIDGDVATWKVKSVSNLNVSGADHYVFVCESASTNSDKTLGTLVSKQAGVQFIPYIGDRVFVDINRTISDTPPDNTFDFDFSRYDSFRWAIDVNTAGGSSILNPINLVDGQTGYIYFEQAGGGPGGFDSQFNFGAPFVDADDFVITDVMNWICYEYRIINDKIWLYKRYGEV